MEKIGTRPYVVVYYNADNPLGLFPNNSFFLDAHSALHPHHRRQMKVGRMQEYHVILHGPTTWYVVGLFLCSWIFASLLVPARMHA